MASYGGGISEASPHPHYGPYGPPATQHSQLPPEEDESEWEYEYSKTETETFYVTLDLSQADFTSRDASVINRPGYRGGEKAERAKLYLNRRMSTDNGPDNSDEEGEVSRTSQPKESQPPDDGDDHEVQILDLDTTNPIISYKGRVYSGQWNQNIGTELLMAKRDYDNPLPALRQLDHDVDLLAASCARINVKEKQLKPKDAAIKRQQDVNTYREQQTSQPIVPPAEKWAGPERIAQGNFLEKFIALKKKLGETDEVTVIAKSMEVRTQHNRSRKQKQGHRGKFNLPHTRGPRRSRVNDASVLRTLSIRDVSAATSPSPSVADTMVSTPTPHHWDDLEGEGEEDRQQEGEEDEAMDENGEDDDDEVDRGEDYGSGGEGDENEDVDMDDM
ncbi:uncharacterized protein F4812DRAFT_382119 [Daldinia caldariorum]|uniref:uncharacterized protein n=1 Tax=Daldinia caldariorum TaxID=326644 RepID=UPI002008AEC0|nr:uncharacterized protein F4812DRAFT_382119 [Daldinia caldariorum]KAI1467911.1 hypothetical protein F4812DRAFT_382119 [Daldinia caldariorum]